MEAPPTSEPYGVNRFRSNVALATEIFICISQNTVRSGGVFLALVSTRVGNPLAELGDFRFGDLPIACFLGVCFFIAQMRFQGISRRSFVWLKLGLLLSRRPIPLSLRMRA